MNQFAILTKLVAEIERRALERCARGIGVTVEELRADVRTDPWVKLRYDDAVNAVIRELVS
jgi:hypothetical protein